MPLDPPGFRVVLANLDRDGGRKAADAANTVIDSPADERELTRLTLPAPPAARGVPGARLALRLSLADARRVRLFARDGGGWRWVLGHGDTRPATVTSCELRVPSGGDVELLAEAVTLPGAPDLPGDAITLERRYVNPAGAVVAAEPPVTLRIAPFLLLSNLRPVEAIYLHFTPGTDLVSNRPTFHEVAEALRAAFGERAAPDPDGPPPTPGRTGMLHVVDGAIHPDHWLQDEVEFGYVWAGHDWMRVVLHHPRYERLDAWAGSLPDAGLGLYDDLTWSRPVDSTDFGGNVEPSPPVGKDTGRLAGGEAGPPVPAHPAAPFGKILIGEGVRHLLALGDDVSADDLKAGRLEATAQALAAAGFTLRDAVKLERIPDAEQEWLLSDRPQLGTRPIPVERRPQRTFRIRGGDAGLVVEYVRSPRRDQRAFLAAQGVQPLLPLDVSWLHVGHVDEVVAVIPGPDGARLAMADARLALDLLEAVRTLHRADDGGPSPTDLFRGREWANPASATKPHARLPVAEALKRLAASNRLVDDRLTLLRMRLAHGLGLSERRIVGLPVLFEALPQTPSPLLGTVTTGPASTTVHRTNALTPNMANLVVAGRLLLVPRPCGPRTSRDVVRRILAGRGVPALDAERLRSLTGFWHWAAGRTTVREVADAYGVDPGAVLAHPANNDRPSGPAFIDGGTPGGRWTRIWIPEDTVDVFEAYAASVLAPLDVRFIDVWRPYHTGAGGLHCASNVMREPAETAPGYAGPYWWEAPSS